MITADFLSNKFCEVVRNDENYNRALGIVRKNSQGNVWLIGGYVYRNLANLLYGDVSDSKDFDFVVEQVNDEIILPEGWEKTKNRFGNWKFFKEGKMPIDFILLNRIYHIEKRGMKPCIESHLIGVPLNFQSIVWDVFEERIIGDIGIKALEEKVVRINDREMAELWAEKYGFSLQEMIKQKARELGFNFEL